MKGDLVYRIYGVHTGRERDCCFGAFRTTVEAETEIARLRLREMNGRNWADQYHNCGFVIRETVVPTDFGIPPRPKPRDRYFVRGTRRENPNGAWASTAVEVFRRVSGGKPETVCAYERNYALLSTFEPFRQGGRDFALISPDYTGTSVLDLETGRVVAAETGSSAGFCPVGFYVPDWWDLHDGSVIPGSEHWSDDYEWPSGQFGFVWGCIWGDDSSWKVQYLDLANIQSGVILRDERFGYVELATGRHQSPCFEPEAPPDPRAGAPPFIRLNRQGGKTIVHFAVEMQFHVESGQPAEWQRLRIANFE